MQAHPGRAASVRRKSAYEKPRVLRCGRESYFGSNSDVCVDPDFLTIVFRGIRHS